MSKNYIGLFLGLALIAVSLTYYFFYEEKNNDVQLSDFTSSYVCPRENAPQFCDTPVQISVECVMPGDHYDNRNRDLTQQEIITLQKVCKFLPTWLNADPRITVLDEKQENHFYFSFSLRDKNFNGLMLISKKRRSGTPITRANPNFDFVNPVGFYIKESIKKLVQEGYIR